MGRYAIGRRHRVPPADAVAGRALTCDGDGGPAFESHAVRQTAGDGYGGRLPWLNRPERLERGSLVELHLQGESGKELAAVDGDRGPDHRGGSVEPDGVDLDFGHDVAGQVADQGGDLLGHASTPFGGAHVDRGGDQRGWRGDDEEGEARGTAADHLRPAAWHHRRGRRRPRFPPAYSATPARARHATRHSRCSSYPRFGRRR